MAGGFGFANYGTQRKTPSSQAVGQALLQRSQGAGPMAPMEMSAGPGMMAPDEQQPLTPGTMMPPAPDDVALRQDGARRMTGAGQIDDNAADDDGVHSANAVNVAIGEALTRMGGGYTTSQNRFKPRDRAAKNLQQLGLSETEAMLLIKSGGV